LAVLCGGIVFGESENRVEVVRILKIHSEFMNGS
jgi:hypothetical protein